MSFPGGSLTPLGGADIQMTTPAYTEEMAQRGQYSGQSDLMIDPATGNPYGYVPGQTAQTGPQGVPPPTAGLPLGDTFGNPYGGMTPGQALGGGFTMPQPPILDMNQPTQQQSLFQPQTPPGLAQQIASPASGVQQLINQLTPPPPRAAPPQPQFAPPPRVDMDFLRQPSMISPQPGQTPFSPPPRVDMDFLRQPVAQPQPQPAPFSPPPRVDMDFLRAPAPMAQPQPQMPTQATQGYQSRIPSNRFRAVPIGGPAVTVPRPNPFRPAPAPAPAPRAAPKPAPKPAPRPVAKPVARNPFQQSRLNRLPR